MSVGKRQWVIAEGYLPDPGPQPDDPKLRSHETACILNAGEQEAQLQLTIYFADREPQGPYRFTVPARRTLHLRFDDLQAPAPVPRETDFSALFESSVPVVVQHTRLDARPQALALMTTLAFAGD